MNLPNKLTMFRVALIIPFMICLICGGTAPKIAALVIFMIASATDWLDGFIARRDGLVTNFGKFADPLADKLLTFSAITIFTGQGKFSSVALFIILARELAVTGFRLIAVEKGVVIAAAWSGKVKTFVQLVAIIILLITEILAEFGVNIPYMIIYSSAAWIMAALTVYSGCEYFIKNRKVLSDN